MSRDLREHRLYVAMDADQVMRFATVQLKSKLVAEISWMAVKPERQHHGVGPLLIDHLETVDPYPQWEPGNPCAIYVKAL